MVYTPDAAHRVGATGPHNLMSFSPHPPIRVTDPFEPLPPFGYFSLK